jgi:hypothetical protein
VISSTPPASLTKNSKLNCKTSTGHIDMVKKFPERYDSKLLGASIIMKNKSEQVKKTNSLDLPYWI